MATTAALASVFLALTAAPLMLASGVVLRSTSRRLRLLWLGLISSLLVAACAAGVLALALLVA